MIVRRVGLVPYLLLIATAALVLLFFHTRAGNVETHNRRIDIVSQLSQTEGELDRNVLMTVSFLLVEYDPFVKLSRQFDTLLQRLDAENTSLSKRSDIDFAKLLRAYREALDDKFTVLERIKSREALVRNGLYYLPAQVAQLHRDAEAAGGEALLLLTRLYSYKLFSADSEQSQIGAGIDRLEGMATGDQPYAKDIRNVVLHMRALLRYLGELKSQLDRYMAVPTTSALAHLHKAYVDDYAEQSHRSEIFSYVLLLIAVTLFAGLGIAMRRIAVAREQSEHSWNQLRDAVESLTEAFALFSRDGKLVLINSRYRDMYPWLDSLLRPGVSLDKLARKNRASGMFRSGGDFACTSLPCDGRSTYVEELQDDRWLRASDSCTSDGERVCVRVDITEMKRNERQLRKLYRALEQSPASVVITDIDGTIEYVNPKFEEITGYAEEEVIGQNPRILKSGDKSPDEYKGLWDTISAGKIWRGQFHNKRKDGGIYWESASISPVRDEEGNISHFIAVKEDITARKRAEDTLRMNATVFETTTEAIMVTDEDNVIKTVNPAFSRITGFAPEDVIGKTPKILSSGRHDSRFYQQMWQSLSNCGYWSGEIWNRRKDGSVYPEWLSLAAIQDDAGAIREHVAVFSDITRRKQDEEQIRRQANYDALTGLPNRSLLLDRLGTSLKSAHREHWRVALLFVDLDRFKEVNDSLGHVVGDELLQQVAERLSACVRETDTVARFGGDEFVLLLEDIEQANNVADVAKKILSAVGKPFQLSGREVFIGASIGITLYPDDTDDADTMLRNADMAMYRAKDAGRNNYQFFTLSMNDQVQQRIVLESDLRTALERDQLTLYYQPLVRGSDGRTVGVEALIRWQHPERGMVPPDQFIPMAEDTGLIAPIGRWVLQTACAQVAAWRARGLDLSVNVNLSSRQLLLGLQVAEIAELLERYALPSDALHLEITERLVMEGNQTTLDWLNQVRSLGVCLAMDDFGTGYSSLSYLKRFPMNILKIDRAFVCDLPKDRGDASLVHAIIAMAESLELKVVAEGVETPQQMHFLRKAGCDVMQGYYFSRPMPAHEIPTFMESQVPQNA